MSTTADATDRVQRVLVVRLGAVGDVVRTLPAVSAMRHAWPSAHIAWLVETKASGVVRSQPWIDDVIVFPREELVAHGRRGRLLPMARVAVGFASALRGQRFDRVFDFHANLKSGVLSRLSGAADRFGFDRSAAREGSWLLATRRAALPAKPVSRFQRNAALAALAGVDVEKGPPSLVVPPAARKRIGQWTAASGALQGRAFVTLHPGSSPSTPYKRYPVGRLAAVGRTLADDGLGVVATWGPAPGERAAAEALVARGHPGGHAGGPDPRSDAPHRERPLFRYAVALGARRRPLQSVSPRLRRGHLHAERSGRGGDRRIPRVADGDRSRGGALNRGSMS
jgi:ADP-heptose:LPS heptosyltransferase